MQLQLSAAFVLLAGLVSASATPNANADANANADLMTSHNLVSRSFLGLLASGPGISRRAAVEYDDETSFSIGELEELAYDEKCFVENCLSEKNTKEIDNECNFSNSTWPTDGTYVPSKEQGTCLCKSEVYIRHINT